MEKIRLVGTSHVSKESSQIIKDEFLNFKPDIICVELDQGRLKSLIGGKSKIKLSMIRHIGITGFLFAIIGRYVQQKLGKVTGVMPGEDMLTAVKLAGKNEKRLALIDRQVQITMKRLSKNVSFKEKSKIVWDVLSSPFRKTLKIKLDVTKIPEDELVEKLTKVMKQRYPQMHNVLIQERNEIMTKRIIHIHENNPDKKIMVVIGAGHKKGMQQRLHQKLQSHVLNNK